MADVIIWGAGKAALKRYDWAVFAGYNVLFFVDNNPDLWGENINGVFICPPESIREYHCLILTSDLYFEEIEAQLDKMTYKGRQVGFKLFKKEVLCENNINVDFPNVNIGGKTSFMFDAYFPEMNWGGTEEWSCMVANELSTFGVQTWMICGMNDKFDKFTHNCLHFAIDDDITMIKKIAQKIVEHLPCVFVSRMTIALYAARMVKTLFPDKIKLIAMVHGDIPNNYRELKFWSDRIDKIVCISNKIQSELQRCGIEKERLEYRPNPIRIPVISEKREANYGTLKIGFAARLVKVQKRAHLLPEIIEVCIRKNLDVVFYIAGEGECLELIKRYVSDNQLEKYVHVSDWIPPTEMGEFWKAQDVYLNISEYEGMSLAMLEAMACGVVPVVTEVSGVSDMIEDGKNGFVVSVDHWLETADKIEILNNNRELLYNAGIYNMQTIRKKCNVADYARWMRDTFDTDFGKLTGQKEVIV